MIFLHTQGEQEQIPDSKIESMNAYLGAEPIAAALARGAQIIVTGRCVDSALAAGALMHEFGWKAPQVIACVCAEVYACMYVSLCVYVCICVCVFVCTCVRACM